MTRARDLADSADKDISGTLTVDDLTASGDVSVGGNLSVSGTTTTIDSANAQTVDLGDNDKIRLGDDDDLQIYHDGSRSIIQDNGTGNLRIQANNLELNNADNSENYLFAANNGAVTLYHDNAEKLATTSSGVDVTGTLTADGLTVESSGNNYARINSTGSNTRLYLDRGSVSSRSQIVMQTSGAETGGAWALGMWDDETFRIEDWTGTDTTRLTIDANGNVLVGTSDNNPNNNNAGSTADNGIKLGPEGLVSIAAYNNPTQVLNRTGTAGTIADLRKDGSTVGIIGTAGDDLVIGTGASAIRFRDGTPELQPWNVTTNAAVDGTIDIGASSRRFKDLYLSGGAYIGGTGASNKLDSYEEGTWNGTATSSGSATLSVVDELYTKIGRIVHVSFTVNFSGSGNSGSLVVDNLPFSAVGTTPVGIGREDATNGYAVFGRMTSGSDDVDIWSADSASNATPFKVAAGNIRFSITYKCE